MNLKQFLQALKGTFIMAIGLNLEKLFHDYEGLNSKLASEARGVSEEELKKRTKELYKAHLQQAHDRIAEHGWAELEPVLFPKKPKRKR